MSDQAALIGATGMLSDRVQQYLRAVVAREREPISAGAFVLYAHPTDAHPFLNYAIPKAGARAGGGAELMRAASERRLVPRLEYLEICFPWVEDALTASGFTREARLRVMTCTPDRLAASETPVELMRLKPESPFVRPMLTVTGAAFGEPPPDDTAVARWHGNTVIALKEGDLLGSASWTTVIDGVSEVVGVAVAEQVRRCGIGTALTIAATRGAFVDGASLAVLTPGDDDSAHVYARAGFRGATTMLHLSHVSP